MRKLYFKGGIYYEEIIRRLQRNGCKTAVRLD